MHDAVTTCSGSSSDRGGRRHRPRPLRRQLTFMKAPADTSCGHHQTVAVDDDGEQPSDRWQKTLQVALKERMWLERRLGFLTNSLRDRHGESVAGSGAAASAAGGAVRTGRRPPRPVIGRGPANGNRHRERSYSFDQHVEFLRTVGEELNVRREECLRIKSQLTDKTKDCDRLAFELEKVTASNLELFVRNGETKDELHRLQQQLRNADEQRRELEREQSATQDELRRREDDVSRLQSAKETDRKTSAEAIETLQSKLRELHKKCELQKVRHEELVLEMDSLRRVSKDKEKQSSAHQQQDQISRELGERISSPVVVNGPRVLTSSSVGGGGCSLEYSATTANEIQKIMAKLEQDNRILAELDRTRPSTTGASSGVSMAAATTQTPVAVTVESGFSSAASSYVSSVATTATCTTTMTTTSSTTMTTTSTSMNKSNPGANVVPSIVTSDHDERAGAGRVGTVNLNPTSSGVRHHQHHQHHHHQQPSPPPTSVSSGGPVVGGGVVEQQQQQQPQEIDLPIFGRVQVFVARYTYDPLQHSPNDPAEELAISAGDYVLVKGTMDEDGFFNGHLLDGRRGLVPSNFIERLTGEDLLEFEQAFALSAQADSCYSDLDGAASLSHEFSALMDGYGGCGGGGSDDQMLIENCLPGDVLCLSTLDNIDDEELLDETTTHYDGQDVFLSALVPPPYGLALERQFHKSILIAWKPPQSTSTTLDAFNVYVDGELRTTVLATERTRALVEGVDSLRPHRLSIRSVTPNRRMSVDAACTLIIGKGVPVAPSCVRASSITSTSAIISWLPSNSNLQHVVCVNSVEVRMLKPGVYRHTITGLSPNTTYRVTVRVKNVKSAYTDEKPSSSSAAAAAASASSRRIETSSTSVDFRTLPKGLPDPPLDVQVEPGPQDGTLLVTWLPVTINTTGTSNGSQVSGYAVYADGKKVVDIDSPTGDHALLEIGKFLSTSPRLITVRTKSGDSGVSQDSVPSVVPAIAGHPASSRSPKKTSPGRTKKQKKMAEQGSAGGLDDETQQNRGGARRGIEDLQESYDQEESSEPSELSDIAEEGEEDVNDPHHHHADKGRGLQSARRDWRGKDQGPGEGKTKAKAEVGSSKASRKDVEKSSFSSRSDQRRTGGPASSTTTTTGRRHEQTGQTVFDPDENLSDKEIYPRSSSGHHGGGRRQQQQQQHIPAIEITKDAVNYYSDEEYEHRGRGRSQKQPQQPQSQQQQPQQQQPQSQQHQSRQAAHPSSRGDPRSSRDPRREPRGAIDQQQHPRQPQQPPQQRQAREQHHRVRSFVALFDYDPKTMSPNPGAAMEELPFREGQLIKIYGEKDPDGFYWGEAAGRQGFVPCNMVSQVQGDEETTTVSRRAVPPPRRTDNPQLSTSAAAPAGGVHHRRPAPSTAAARSVADRGGSTRFSDRGQRERWSDGHHDGHSVKKMVAMYDYDPQELSPNVDAEVELSFSTGDVIYVYGEMDEDGFFMGEMDGVRGLVPSNFLTDAPPDYSNSGMDDVPGGGSGAARSMDRSSAAAASRSSHQPLQPPHHHHQQPQPPPPQSSSSAKSYQPHHPSQMDPVSTRRTQPAQMDSNKYNNHTRSGGQQRW